MKKIFKFLIALMICGLILSNTVRATSIVYEQLPGHYGGYMSGQYGDYPPDPLLFTVADDFQLSQLAEIVGIKWWGGYGSPNQSTPTDNFIIMLFDDNAGEPGNLLYHFNVGLAPVREATGNWVNPFIRPEFEYFYNLPTSFMASANTRYWLSIVNIPSADLWLWEVSSPGTVQRSFNTPVNGPWVWEPYLDNMAFQLLISSIMRVSIDIKPGSFPNSINLSSEGVIPVAILSSETFDATTVNPATVSLAGAKVKMAGNSGKYLCHKEDVNRDNIIDLVCQVVTAEFMIEEGESVAILEAETFDGTPIRGEDIVTIVSHAGGAKVDVCHRTGSATNPYVLISVRDQAVKDHLRHGDFLWDPLRYDTSCNPLANCGDAPKTAGISCRRIKDTCGPVTDGVYWVDPNGAGSAFQVYCDMTRHGGGWMLVAKLGEWASPTSDFTSDLNVTSLLNGNPPESNEYAHWNLARFNAFERDWMVRTDTDAYNDQTHFQFVFYRPDPAQSCLPGLAGTNWKGTSTNTLLLHLTKSSTTGLANTTWLSVPECSEGHCENDVLLWTYRRGDLESQCLNELGQTQICHSVQGAIATWGPGTMTAAFGMQDGVDHDWAKKGTYWIKDVNTAETP